MEKQQWLDYFSNLHKNTDLNLVDEFARVNRIEMKHREVLPAFFTGDILSKNKYLFFSINPQYKMGITEEEQGLDKIEFDDIQGVDYKNWFETCLNRFEFYKTQNIGMHKIFYNFYKMINNQNLRREKNTSSIALKFMQDKVINVDWIPYYSGTIGTVNFYNHRNQPFNELLNSWNNIFEKIIIETQPKFIFLHGGRGKFREFLELNSDINIEVDTPITSVRSMHGLIPLFRGNMIFNQKVPVLYLANFINHVNSNESIAEIYKHLKEQGLVD